MISIRQRKVLIPSLLLALVISLALFGYHSDMAPLSLRKPHPAPSSDPHSRPPPHGPHGPPPPGPEGHGDHAFPANNSTHVPSDTDGYWTKEEIEGWAQKYHPDYPNPDVKQEHVPSFFPSSADRMRFENAEVWRDPETYKEELTSDDMWRPKLPGRDNFKSDSDFLRQPIPGDFAVGTEKIFIMMKTGFEVMWDRLPVHMMTTLTRTPNFALYSDAPGTIFGHEIIDCLKDLPEDVLQHDALQRYLAAKQMHEENWNWSPEFIKASGGWECDKYKNLPILEHAVRNYPDMEWFVMIDDDTYVFMENLANLLSKLDPKEPHYLGSKATAGVADEGVEFAHGGSGIVVSRAAAELLFKPNDQHKTVKSLLENYARIADTTCCGDAMLAWALKKQGVLLEGHEIVDKNLLWWGSPFNGESLSGLMHVMDRLCVPIATWHHLTPHDVERLWEYERLWNKDRYIVYADMYRDFVLPYITDEKPNWMLHEGHLREWFQGEVQEITRSAPVPINNAPAGEKSEEASHTEGAESAQKKRAEGEAESGESSENEDGSFTHRYYPADVKDHCIAICKEDEECSAWSWTYGECRISQSRSITFGIAGNKWNKKQANDGQWTTGWMIDRIRRWRADSPCDPLTYDKATDTWSDDENTSEGWYLRKLAKDKDRFDAFPEDSTIPQTLVPK